MCFLLGHDISRPSSVIVAVRYDKLPSNDQLEVLNLALATNIDQHIFLVLRLDDLVVQLCKLACRYIQGAGTISYRWKSTDVVMPRFGSVQFMLCKSENSSNRMAIVL
jgi:hypothetical protein